MGKIENTEQTPIMSQANALAQGMNIYGTRDVSSFIKLLVSPAKAAVKTVTFLGKDYEVPEYVNLIQDTETYDEGGTFRTREEVQNSLAAHVGIQGSYGAFSGEMALDYSGEFNKNSQYAYAYRNFYAETATLQFQYDARFLSDEFNERLNELPYELSDENLDVFSSFFNDFGMYFTNKIVLGGSLQFYTAVSVEGLSNVQEISAMMKAQYEALFSSGSLDAGVKNSSAWKQYASHSSTTVRAHGGNPSEVTDLTLINPLEPGENTVNLFRKWVESVSSEPAIIDFTLEGIWQICGKKRQAVQAAWEKYARSMHPHLAIGTRSRGITWPIEDKAIVPDIYIGSVPYEPSSGQPDGPAGYQVVILDSSNLSHVLLDRYYTVPKEQGWIRTYHVLFDQMKQDIQGKLDTAGNILIISSFGIDSGMSPTPDIVGMLRSAGAGEQLNYWLKEHQESQGPGNSWVLYPSNYMLVGIFGNGPDTGIEFYDYNTLETAQLNVYLYREIYSGNYTLGLGEM
ncbi:MAC/perforin domain-containing protein [Paenibacillus pabuli]|uniref:MAC/perforin domain-containing protein n=1 Tax=Paenibacillus pabuli TaxID=1472 RepID=UPI003CF432E1